MQRDLDRVIADLLQRPLRHPDLRALDLVALLLQSLDDVVIGHRAEQASVDARLLRDLQLEAVELRAALLRLGGVYGYGLLQLGAPRLEGLQVVLRRALGNPVRNRAIVRDYALVNSYIPEIAEVGDLF